MSTEILQYVLKYAASKISESIRDSLYEPAADKIEEILNGQEQIRALIEEVSHKEALRESMNLI